MTLVDRIVAQTYLQRRRRDLSWWVNNLSIVLSLPKVFHHHDVGLCVFGAYK